MKNQVVVAIAILAATSIWMLIPHAADTTAEVPESNNKAIVAVPATANVDINSDVFTVRVSRIDPQTYVEQVRVRGRTEASRHVEVRAEEAGRIVSEPVARGARVAAGDVLCEISVDNRAANLQEALSHREQSEFEYSAALDLQQRRLQSDVIVAQLKAARDSAIAAVMRAELAMEKTRIRAPFAGVVETRTVDVGDLLNVGAVCASVLDDEPMLLIGLVPLAIFALLSSIKTIGAHWLLSFVPFVLMVFARALPETRRAATVRFFAGFAAAHVLVIAIVAMLPLETWQHLRKYDGIVMTIKAPELLERLRPFERDYVFATDGYSPSVTLSYNAQRYFAVFGPASSHARHDDILTDFSALHAQNILILHKSRPRVAEDYAPYFREVEVREFELHGTRFWIVLGRGFDYPAYREGILEPARRHWYAVPDWLPMTHCYFCERYFPERACRAGTR